MEPAIKKLSSTPEDGLASSPEPTTAHVQDDPANSPKPIAVDVEPIRARADPITEPNTSAGQGTSGTALAPQMAAGRSPVRKNVSISIESAQDLNGTHQPSFPRLYILPTCQSDAAVASSIKSTG
ncbi:hypothetical protein PGT21_012048 [Puccinia graminis f. sp. tritici]|uniref:Uncharacterized protein n=1 Tax=Puccinia graminis f. sp. tritici TaxID=56615 RepID=A0A5B0P9A6_PUCGR|nr:hypothetical protein PGTUg99_008454 [Puccinia graminis f. sp. tritici]KAA1105572.1 hypothetical protein PGT21_012048 [Puccinia graminis f. sp. tritici]